MTLLDRRLPWRLRYSLGARVGSVLRRLALLATHRHGDLDIPRRVHIGPGFSLYMPHRGTLTVGSGVEMRRGVTIEITGDGRVAIGPDAVLTYGPVIQCSTSVGIGRGAIIAQGVTVVDGQHRFREHDLPWDERGFDLAPVRIGTEALILAKATVMADVGDHAVVGAHAVVTRPVPSYCLAVGVPARVVEYFGPAELRPPGV